MKSKIHQPVPELPVRAMEESQAFYRDSLGFTVAWTDSGKTISGISREDAVIFLREHDSVNPVTIWIFTDDVDETYRAFIESSISIHETLETKPWGLRQFSIQDPDQNKLIFHG
jgi:hypothetical protein